MALAGAVSLMAVGCDDGPKVGLGEQPAGQGLMGVGGAGEEGTSAERDLNWARGEDGVIDGRVQSTDFRKLIVDDHKGNRHYLSFNPGTVIRRDGQPASLLVLEPGAEIRASFVTWKGDQVAAEIDVIAPPKHHGPFGEAPSAVRAPNAP